MEETFIYRDEERISSSVATSVTWGTIRKYSVGQTSSFSWLLKQQQNNPKSTKNWSTHLKFINYIRPLYYWVLVLSHSMIPCTLCWTDLAWSLKSLGASFYFRGKLPWELMALNICSTVVFVNVKEALSFLWIFKYKISLFTPGHQRSHNDLTPHQVRAFTATPPNVFCPCLLRA